MWERLLGAIRSIGTMLFVVAMLVVSIGLFATCQFARGQIRPYLPPVIRDLVSDPESEAAVDEYLHDVDGVLNRLLKDTEECSAKREQPCLTAAFERAYKGVGDGVPVEASWISGAHGRLHDALYEMWQIHLRSETEPPTSQLVDDSMLALDEFTQAVDEWYSQAKR
jgi:hypothetical protein